MIRSDALHWLKAGVEFAHGRATLGAVLAQSVSDWSMGPAFENFRTGSAVDFAAEV